MKKNSHLWNGIKMPEEWVWEGTFGIVDDINIESADEKRERERVKQNEKKFTS